MSSTFSAVADWLDELESEEEEPWPGVDWGEVSKGLASDGFAVVDGATGRGLAARLKGEVLALREACLLESSPNALGDALETKTGVQELLLHGAGSPLVSSARVVAARALCPSLRDFASGPGKVVARRLGPKMYVDEVKAQFQDGAGSCFPCHYDTSSESKRRATCILYLNEEFKGGHLRILPLGSSPVDIAPIFDRLVIFSSTAVLHRTTPTFCPRACVSFWIGSSDPTFFLPTGQSCASCRSYDKRTLTQLAHHEEYRASFEAAFPKGPALDKALSLDEDNTKLALSNLPDSLRTSIRHNRFCPCSSSSSQGNLPQQKETTPSLLFKKDQQTALDLSS